MSIYICMKTEERAEGQYKYVGGCTCKCKCKILPRTPKINAVGWWTLDKVIVPSNKECERKSMGENRRKGWGWELQLQEKMETAEGLNIRETLALPRPALCCFSLSGLSISGGQWWWWWAAKWKGLIYTHVTYRRKASTGWIWKGREWGGGEGGCVSSSS